MVVIPTGEGGGDGTGDGDAEGDGLGLGLTVGDGLAATDGDVDGVGDDFWVLDPPPPHPIIVPAATMAVIATINDVLRLIIPSVIRFSKFFVCSAHKG